MIWCINTAVRIFNTALDWFRFFLSGTGWEGNGN
jgi:hypothetical protein